MAIGDIIVGIDVGASKISCIVGQVNKYNEIDIIGNGICNNNGIKKGIIIEPQSVARSIRNAIEEAENNSGLAINSAYVNAKGLNVRIEKIIMESEIEKPDDGMTINDIYNAFSKIQMTTRLDDGEQIIDILPYEYYVKDRKYKEEPIGAFCKTFSIKAEVVIAKANFVESLMTTLKYAQLELDGIILETLATSNVTLMNEEKQIGVMLVDIGSGHTDISVYKNSELEYYDSIPVGGDHITNDIAITFNISGEEAEKLKKQYNLAIQAMITNNHEVKLMTTMSSDDKTVIRCSDIVRVIEERIKEIYQIIRKILADKNLIGKVECMVLTGQGISNIIGVEEFAMLTTKLNQVRLANPKTIVGLKPQYMTAYGMIKYISSLSESKHVNSNVEILKDPSVKEKIAEKIALAKDKISDMYRRIRKIDKDE
ncbi:MAG: cell division protein FtsA [Clostridia bacterium]|nr:cell division protein FtsA [Clostridia bacterium]